MKKALIVGIDYHTEIPSLYGCVADANAVNLVLERHADGSNNFSTQLLCSSGPSQYVCGNELRTALIELFNSDVETALFYFSGHGYVDELSGYLITSEYSFGDAGLSVNDILVLANNSPASNKIIILDIENSCASESELSCNKFSAEVAEGVSFIAVSTTDQYTVEDNGSGLFTSAFINALNGDAADLLGHVSLNSTSAYMEQFFGLWEQTPVLKNHIHQPVSLRHAAAPIALPDLLQINELFPEADHEIRLDTRYLPDMKGRNTDWPAPDPEKSELFRILLKYSQLKLVETVSSPCIMSAALDETTCKLTRQGEHLRMQVNNKRI